METNVLSCLVCLKYILSSINWMTIIIIIIIGHYRFTILKINKILIMQKEKRSLLNVTITYCDHFIDITIKQNKTQNRKEKEINIEHD